MSAALPQPSRRLVKLFSAYLAWYMRRHFHAIRISEAERFARNGDSPLVVYLNHASWWDPLTCLVLSRALMPEAAHYAPMDADALAHYSFFSRLGIFPIEINKPRGAAQFLQASQAILAQRDTVLWITPQGEFADVRTRPVQLKSGLGALAARLAADARGATFLPLAIEYTYWNERLPEVLLRCGEPVHFSSAIRYTTDICKMVLGAAMSKVQDELAALSVGRDAAPFRTIVAGSAGVGGAYDVWQRIRARTSGRAYAAEHGSLKRAKPDVPRA